MTERAIDLFRENEQAMTAIAPAGQTNLGLAQSFNGAVQQLNVAPTHPQMSADNDNMENKKQLAMQAEDTCYSLKECLKIAPAPKTGDMGYGVAQIGDAAMALTNEIGKIFGAQPDDKMDMENGPEKNPMFNPQSRPAMAIAM